MSVLGTLTTAVSHLLAQAPGAVSTAGTALSQRGAAQRLSEPNYYDVVFPFIAFFLVIVVPTSIALWVITKTIREKTPEPDET